MKAIMILENGFEDTEGLTTFDVLKRAGIEVDTVSLYNNEIVTQSGHSIKTKLLLNNINKPEQEYDFLVLPGGKAVFQVLDKSKEIDDLIDKFINNNKLVAAICAAPSLIGKRGYFEGLKYTCFPGCDTNILKGTRGRDGVIVNDKFITATSMYYSIEFALAIIEKVLGIEKAKQTKNSLMGK